MATRLAVERTGDAIILRHAAGWSLRAVMLVGVVVVVGAVGVMTRDEPAFVGVFGTALAGALAITLALIEGMNADEAGVLRSLHREASFTRSAVIVDGAPLAGARDVQLRHVPAADDRPDVYQLFAVGAREVVRLGQSTQRSAFEAIAGELRGVLGLGEPGAPRPLSVPFGSAGVVLRIVALLVTDLIAVGALGWAAYVARAHPLAVLAGDAVLFTGLYLATRALADRATRGWARRWVGEQFGVGPSAVS